MALVAGDFDYEAGGTGYAMVRQTDPRVAAQVHAALGDARSVLNVGAGAGSYEPLDRHVVALEPAAAMRAQRPRHLAPAVRGVAGALPFDDGAFDAAMAMMTVHQWPELQQGLAEMRRVTRGPVVVMSADGATLGDFWLGDYVPELFVAEAKRMPPLEAICEGLGGRTRIEIVPVPVDCVDGFCQAFYARPERMLDPQVRAAQSSWGFIDKALETRFVERLTDDLASGAWDERYGTMRTMPSFDGSLRMVVSLPEEA
ncbi:MAG: class I SAM-dependent methyltransferase [Parvibaculaceae bacterium]